MRQTLRGRKGAQVGVTFACGLLHQSPIFIHRNIYFRTLRTEMCLQPCMYPWTWFWNQPGGNPGRSITIYINGWRSGTTWALYTPGLENFQCLKQYGAPGLSYIYKLSKAYLVYTVNLQTVCHNKWRSTMN